MTPPNEPTFCIDESIASNILILALRGLGEDVRCVGEVIPRGSPDDDWLKMCGENRWIALTRDQDSLQET